MPGNIYILGSSCFKNDNAACLLRNADIVAVVQAERFTQKKAQSEISL